MPHGVFQEPTDATPLAPEERADLIPAHIAYRAELNAAEQENIARGQDWALARKRHLLSEKFIRDLHRRMFGDVWRWAGRFRTTERNLGIPHFEIPMAVCALLQDAKTWVEHKTYPPDEIAVRFHHRLVAIHPFPKWQRETFAADGGPAGDEPGRGALHLGKSEPAAGQRASPTIHRGAARWR